MRNPAMTFLTLFLALALVGQPLQALACPMNLDQGHDHSSLQMNHTEQADSEYCDTEPADAPGDCAVFMGCGSCFAGSSMIPTPPQAAVVCRPTAAVDFDSGQIVPPHSSPPYYPPIL
jgi:hypothetical protein